MNFKENVRKLLSVCDWAGHGFSFKISAFYSYEIAWKCIKLYKYTCLHCEKPSNVFWDHYLRFKGIKHSSNERRLFLYAAIFEMPQEESSKLFGFPPVVRLAEIFPEVANLTNHSTILICTLSWENNSTDPVFLSVTKWSSQKISSLKTKMSNFKPNILKYIYFLVFAISKTTNKGNNQHKNTVYPQKQFLFTILFAIRRVNWTQDI